uniref:Uncharacterized protein n=1 Tax=Aegilops tauschii subsp. strangulata TaxID=200361 RepID=A0A453S188_AEGTS
RLDEASTGARHRRPSAVVAATLEDLVPSLSPFRPTVPARSARIAFFRPDLLAFTMTFAVDHAYG